jgi:hypothetical protein
VHHPQARIELRLQLQLLECRVLVALREVERAGDAVPHMVQAAMQREPVEILGRAVVALRTGDRHPVADELIRSQAAKRTLPDVTVRGDEARDDDLALGVDGLGRREVGRRGAIADRDNLAVGADRKVADKRFLLARFDREERAAGDEKLDGRGGGRAGGQK